MGPKEINMTIPNIFELEVIDPKHSSDIGLNRDYETFGSYTHLPTDDITNINLDIKAVENDPSALSEQLNKINKDLDSILGMDNGHNNDIILGAIKNASKELDEFYKRIYEFENDVGLAVDVDRARIEACSNYSYSELSAFVGSLVNIGIIDHKDFISQLNKCEGWSPIALANIYSKIKSFIRGDLTSTLSEIKNLIRKANPAPFIYKVDRVHPASLQAGIVYICDKDNVQKEYRFDKSMTPNDKMLIINNILYNSGGKITNNMVSDFVNNGLSAEDIAYWKANSLWSSVAKPTKETFLASQKEIENLDYMKDYPTDNASKKSAKIDKEVEKINRLLEDDKLGVADLDKYVALGVISSAGLKAWRIADQEENNYFYDNIDDHDLPTVYDIAHNDLVDLDLSMGTYFEPATPVSTLKTEAKKAAYRVAGTQVNNITRAAIIKAIPDDKAEFMKSFLASNLGSSFIGMVGGMTLTHTVKDNAIVQDLAKELRVSSLTTLGNEAVDTLMDSVVGIIKSSVKELPNSIEETIIPIEYEDQEMLLEEDEVKANIGNCAI